MRIAIIAITVIITFILKLFLIAPFGVLFMYQVFYAFYFILKTIEFSCSIFAKIHNRVGGFGGRGSPTCKSYTEQDDCSIKDS